VIIVSDILTRDETAADGIFISHGSHGLRAFVNTSTIVEHVLRKRARGIAVFVASDISKDIGNRTITHTRPVVPKVLFSCAREVAELVLCFSNCFFLKRESTVDGTVTIPEEILVGKAGVVTEASISFNSISES